MTIKFENVVRNIVLCFFVLAFTSSCTKTVLKENEFKQVSKTASTTPDLLKSQTVLSVDGIYTNPFYRYWNPVFVDHFYTIDQANYVGYTLEKIECNVFTDQVLGVVPFYKYWNNVARDHFYTVTQGNYTGYVYEGIACYVFTTPQVKPTITVPLYKYWNNKRIDHFYTVTYGTYPDYVYEGIAGYVQPVE